MGRGAHGLWSSSSQGGIPQNVMSQAHPDSGPMQVPGQALYRWRRACTLSKHSVGRHLTVEGAKSACQLHALQVWLR